MKLSNRSLLAIAIFLLFLVTILTQFYGNADIGDYADVAKFFAGDYHAEIRSSHSYFYGFICSPFIKLTGDFLGMKLMTLVWLILLMLSIYHISGRNKRSLLLIITAPVFWYMAPIINPIQIASLFFLWGYYFLKKYNSEEKIKYLIYSGLFFGLAWVFWDTSLHFGILITLCFFWNKKFSHLLLFLIFVFLGLLPRLILDQFLFNFPFYTVIKSFTGGFVNSLWPGTLGSGHSAKTFISIFSTVIMLPLFSYILFIPKNFVEDKKTNIFLILAFILILSNPQPRYMLFLVPILILNLSKKITLKQLKISICVSMIIILLVVFPYLVQIKYSTNSPELTAMASNFGDITFNKESIEEIWIVDLNKISEEFPKEIFLVGPLSDDYSILARNYWGENIKEFVSIQDYNLWVEDETTLFEKEFRPISNIDNRREIWIRGGIDAKINSSEFKKINYLISLDKRFSLNGFELIREYDSLYLYKKNT